MTDTETDYKALIDRARDYQKNSHLLSSGAARTFAGVQTARSLTADFIGQLADAVEALIEERDALRAQLDDMTTEWGYSSGGDYVVPETPDGRARRLTAAHPETYILMKRLVGPWEEA